MAQSRDSIDKPRLNRPKAPHSTKGWEALDIFVFSNGQQHSPPRKYHLNAKDLNWWKTTLGYIARSKYGAMYSTIELYSIDGIKINSPLELLDGSAYVAVIPPDAFINASYQKYIIKASNSWKKRQLKLNNVTEVSTSSAQSIFKMSKESLEEINQIMAQPVSSQKTVQCNAQQGSQNDNANVNLKPKRRSYSSSNRTSILRKFNNEFNKSPVVKKSVKKKGEHIKVKEVFNLNYKIINDAPKVQHSSLLSENDTHENPLMKKKSDVTNSIEKIKSKGNNETEYNLEETKIVLSNPLKVSTPADKKESSENYLIKYIPEDKEIAVVSNPPKKEESDLMYLFRNFSDLAQDNKLKDSLFPNLLTNDQAVKEAQTSYAAVKSITRASSPIGKSFRNYSKTKAEQAAQPEIVINDEPFVAVTNNEDAINLKLSINLKFSGGVFSNVQANIVQTPQCSENAAKEHQKIVGIGEITKDSKSLKSLRDCDCECSKKESNIYKLQCTCDTQETTTKYDKIYANILDENNAPKAYLMVIPIVTVVEKDSTRKPNQETSKQNTEKENDDQIVTVVNFMDGDQEMYYFPRSLPLSIEYKDISIRSVTNVDRYAMSLDIEMARTSSKSTHASTQTEWCRTVLEFRRHEDGRYTFHFPPLQILRIYNKDP